ncbi:MAG: STAS domain-containing protein [Planctomycetota bacterium]|jgi:anti-sigma B factor antagonist
MEMKTRDIDEIKIIDFDGELDTTTAPDAEAYLQEVCEGNGCKILINLESLEYTSSAGLRVLLATAKRLQASDGVLRICCLNETIQEIFDVSGFTTILNVNKTEEEALSAF